MAWNQAGVKTGGQAGRGAIADKRLDQGSGRELEARLWCVFWGENFRTG